MIQYLIVAVLITSAAVGYGTWEVTGWYYDTKIAAQLQKEQELREVAEKRATEIADRFESKLANLKVVNRTINKEVQREVLAKEYDCPIPATGVGMLNRARGAEVVDPLKSEAALSTLRVSIPEDSRRTLTSSRLGRTAVP